MPRATIELKIRRQDAPSAPPRWEEFSLPYRPNMNVISCLMEIRKRPVTKQGTTTTPPAWEASCLEEVCGSCTMRVNGAPRQSCATLIDRLPPGTVTLEPLTKFQVVRDLIVDRSPMLEALIQVKGWIPIDGTYDLGPGPRIAESERATAYAFSRCMTCGCCMEVCPQYNERSEFIGPAPLAQVRLFNAHPTGRMNAAERLQTIMGRGGLADCGNAQNCVQVCPKEIPLTEAFGELGRQTTLLWLKNLLGK
ncbi:MAG: succinate dehydrogenase iron-sulfur subunit [Candidatus Eisenbacteria bacterium RBG_16_71_46]|nr:MAG: succinate dehydrogenase iron-sulfur subunit [Candidatus Eisenbacteria bacterium RBG_16_71_46]OGF23262.1 MAG: succinate dehydrogenase iron-sulfur subunit [Candidatus Eisenbacteria bacterium RBG_19FT_COMBO_70_11]